MRTYRFRDDARAELLAAIDWYAARDVASASELGNVVAASVQEIAERPQAWAAWPGCPEVHRRILRDFPYSIVYLVDADEIVIVAFAHRRRRPGYWLDRVR